MSNKKYNRATQAELRRLEREGRSDRPINRSPTLREHRDIVIKEQESKIFDLKQEIKKLKFELLKRASNDHVRCTNIGNDGSAGL